MAHIPWDTPGGGQPPGKFRRSLNHLNSACDRYRKVEELTIYTAGYLLVVVRASLLIQNRKIKNRVKSNRRKPPSIPAQRARGF